MLNNFKKFVVLAAFGLASATASAAVIISPIGAIIDNNGPGFGSIADTFNQNGLSVGFTSGVTDFDAYLAGTPTHTTTFPGFEWFGNTDTSTATVTYDLGGVMLIDRLALWNEESSGIGLLDLFYSVDGVTFFSLASGLVPTDHGLADYAADVFSFGPVLAQFVTFEMSRCPQPNVGSFPSCAIGEVAFSAAAAVPEPALPALLGLGLAMAAWVGRRNKQ